MNLNVLLQIRNVLLFHFYNFNNILCVLFIFSIFIFFIRVFMLFMYLFNGSWPKELCILWNIIINKHSNHSEPICWYMFTPLVCLTAL